MDKSQFEELKLIIKETTKETVNASFENWKAVFLTRLNNIDTVLQQVLGVVNLTNNDLGHDREALAGAKTQMATIIEGNKELIRIASTQTTRIANDFKDHADDTLKQASKEIAKKVEPVIKKALNNVRAGKPLKKRFNFNWKIWNWIAFR